MYGTVLPTRTLALTLTLTLTLPLTQVKRRMYGTILLLGSVSHTPGLAEYLEWCADLFS